MTTTTINIKARANAASRIFDVLAWIALIIGGIGFIIAGIASLAAIGDGFGDFIVALGLAVSIGFYTILTWASITLATAIAGYIAQKAD